MSKVKYSNKQLTRMYLQDLVVDIRCARRDGLDDYAKSCEHKFRSLWAGRRSAHITRYGTPEVN